MLSVLPLRKGGGVGKASREGKFLFGVDRLYNPSTVYMELKQQIMQMSYGCFIIMFSVLVIASGFANPSASCSVFCQPVRFLLMTSIDSNAETENQ